MVAVLLHYCYTAVFIWMLVEGLHLYSKVVRVFGTERSRITYYVCFGWGRLPEHVNRQPYDDGNDQMLMMTTTMKAFILIS